LTFLSNPSECFSRIERSNLALVCLLDTDSDVTAKVCKALSSKFGNKYLHCSNGVLGKARYVY
jgi:hypothetical protein